MLLDTSSELQRQRALLRAANEDTVAMTAAARAAAFAKWMHHVDPQNQLSPDERKARAVEARRIWMWGIGAKGVRVRREKKEAAA